MGFVDRVYRVGVVFIAIGSSGQHAFLGIGAAFVVLGFVFLARQRRDVLVVFARGEGRRLGMRGLWMPVVAVLVVGVSLGLPQFL